MDIEELTKSQIVLLTLLVSFVTSIATGIVTVSLMDQAPPAITQTINRVVERTVERVVPEETQQATVVTTEKTVVVKESDLIAQAVSRAEMSFVRVYSVTGEKRTPVAVGAAVSPTLAITDPSALAASGTYEVETTDGAVYEVEIEGELTSGKPALLSIIPNEDEERPAVSGAIMHSGIPKLGQTIVALTGFESLSVHNGIVSELGKPAEATESASTTEATPPPPIRTFTTSISSSSLLPGSIIVNTDGSIVGMHIGTGYITAPAITASFKKAGESVSAAE